MVNQTARLQYRCGNRNIIRKEDSIVPDMGTKQFINYMKTNKEVIYYDVIEHRVMIQKSIKDIN